MFQPLLKQKLQYVFGVAGILFVLLSMFTIQDITKLQFTFSSPIKIPPLITGIVFILLALIWHAIPYLTIPLSWTAIYKVRRTEHGFQTSFSHAKVEICFGKLQETFRDFPNSLVVLPANDLFDDECIKDTRTALGVFVNELFPNKVHEICTLVKDKLSLKTKKTNQHNNLKSAKYDIGTILYFERPLSVDVRMAFLAVTTVTEKEGIECEATNILNAVKELHKLMNIRRIDSVILPLIGSGHGGLRPQISLLCTLIAFAECLTKPSGHHIKNIRIVVYKETKHAKPAISQWEIRRLLAFTKKYCFAQ